MDVGDLPFRYVGKHRRAKLKDILALKADMDAQQAAMEALAEDARTLGGAMAFEPTVAVFDACILYPFHLRNIVVQAAVDHLVEGRWTDMIHDEWIRNLSASAPAIPVERLQNTRRVMNEALPMAMVNGYEEHIPIVSLPDPNDRHVVAAGIKLLVPPSFSIPNA